MDTRIWHQVRLELVQVDIERTIEAQAGGDGADDLSNQAVQVLVIWSRDIKIAAADVIDSLVVDKECAVGVLNRAVGGEDSIVRLDNGRRDTRGGVDCKLELRLLAIVGGEALEEQSAETRASAATEGVENEEALKRGAVVCDCLAALPKSIPMDLIYLPRGERGQSRCQQVPCRWCSGREHLFLV